VTNAVAVLPGYLGGSIGYRRELQGQGERIRSLGLASVAGAAVGSVLLLVSPEALFQRLAPLLILFSCALLAAQPALVRRRDATGPAPARRPGPVPMQFAAAIYGGYFGAGVGIMMLAILGLCIDDALHRINALKGVLSLVVGVVSAVFFAVLGPVVWHAAAGMAVASLLGGQVGVHVARRLNATALRAAVIVFGVAVSLVLLLR
jgi:uncharacterized membrane protein YfcA